MASPYTPPIQTLIDEFGKLPGVGPRSAQRIAMHIVKMPREDVNRLAHALTDAKDRVRYCDMCFNLSESEKCSICSDDRRDWPVDRRRGCSRHRRIKHDRHSRIRRCASTFVAGGPARAHP